MKRIRSFYFFIFIFLLTVSIFLSAGSINKAKALTQNGISVNYTISKTQVAPGETFNVTVSIKNVGTTTLNNPMFITEALLTPELRNRYSSYSICAGTVVGSEGCDGAAWQFYLGQLAPGATITRSMVHKLFSDAPVGATSYNADTRITSGITDIYYAPKDWSIKVAAASTPTPTATPTPSPTKIPTPTSTKTPTPSPTKAPTSTPTSTPRAPQTSPTSSPTASPSTTPTTVANENILPAAFYISGSKTSVITKETPNLNNYENFVLDIPGKNKIEFIDPVDASKLFQAGNDISKLIYISASGKVSMDSEKLPGLNRKAKITMFGLQYKQTPMILRNGEDAKDYVSNIRYDEKAGVLTFEVKGFSTYETKEAKATTSQDSSKNKPFSGIVLAATTALVIGIGGSIGGFLYLRNKKAKSQNS